MAKKGAAIQLQIEVDTEEDWWNLVQRSGLIVVDIYSDWCGPCTGMVGNLRKLKLEIGGDILTLAIAKADNISCLERFRNKSEPTWMFISNQRMLRLMFGTNAPRLMRIITDEIDKEAKSIAEHTPRTGIDFDQLTDEEQHRADEEKRIVEEAARIEEEAREQAIYERRVAVADNMVPNVREYNITILFPKVTYEQLNLVHEAMNEAKFSAVGKVAKRILKEEDVAEILFFYDWPFEVQAVKELIGGECSGFCYQVGADFDQDQVIQYMRHVVYGEDGAPPGTEDSLAVKLQYEIEKEESIVSEEEIEEPEEGPIPQSALTVAPSKRITVDASQKSMRSEISKLTAIESIAVPVSAPSSPEEPPPAPEMITIPGIWIPSNEKTKAVAMRYFFPAITNKFDLPEPEVIPPHLIVAFDAFKKKEVLELAAEYPDETMRMGFFSTCDPETAQLISKTSEGFDRILAPPAGAKLVLQVSKKVSEPLLSYALLGPAYVSPNTVVGEKECEVFFPEGYEVGEPIEEEKPTKKKKKKGSKSSKASETSLASSEYLDEMTETKLEGMEEEEILGELEGDIGEMPEDVLGSDMMGDTLEPEVELVEVPEVGVTEEEDKATSPMEAGG